ncbi:MAG TPA: tripartite tricarboxylate transporter TctB family protein [Hyphomicrobiaceae bacterium]|nr:tripartite tricarboxylate transporter TctB family protein [Hyphomicrobiaceae bacterium]
MPNGLDPPNRRRIPRDVVAGLFLCIVAAAAYAGIGSLPLSDGPGVGPGLVPKVASLLIAGLGLFLIALGLVPGAAPLERGTWRGPVFVLGSVVVFAATIRTLGLAFAGPLAVIVSALADKETRVVELLVFAVLMSAFCIFLFKYLLRLPVPLAPVLLGY